MENISLSSTCFSIDDKRQIDFVLAYEIQPPPFIDIFGPIKNAIVGTAPAEKEEGDKMEMNVPINGNNDDGEKSSLASTIHQSVRMENDRKMHTFEKTLREMGLELERAKGMCSNTCFTLIHAPLNVLLTEAELLQIKMPVQKNDIVENKQRNSSSNSMDEGSEGVKAIFRWWFNLLHFGGELQKRLEPVEYFSQPFVAQHFECFVGHEHPETFFSRADRSRMVYNMLCRARYDHGHDGDELCYGIERLVQQGVYNAAYPLHDELVRHAKSKCEEAATTTTTNYAECSDRQLLNHTWVRLSNIGKYQPLDLIKHYYGTKIGFYFAWLGYYTRCLYPMSVFGIFCFAYGIFTANDDVPSNEICSGSEVLVCPTCEHLCDFTPLNSTCVHSKLTYLFDNNATIIFATVMSIWTTLFLEGWKRYHAKLAYKWNTISSIQPAEDEVLRPEFQHRVRRVNPVTGLKEPWVPVVEKGFRICCSMVTVFFFMCLVVAYLIGTIFYAIVVRFLLHENEHSDVLRSNAVFFTLISGAIINLVFILLMNFIYNKVALTLTKWECPRTQADFDNSYTLKVFAFQFVNYFSYIFYIAFIKGRFTSIPADRKSAPHALLEQCEAAGCMVELVIQLAVIMVGQQILSAFFEIVPPILSQRKEQLRLNLPYEEEDEEGEEKMWLQQEDGRRHGKREAKSLLPLHRFSPCSKKKGKTEEERNNTRRKRNADYDNNQHRIVHQYELDYCLNPVYQQFLFDEYLKIVMQLGFVTMFAAAFPLAPLFALLNNIFEIRLDAYKFTIKTRRPVAESVRDIGIWYQILNMLSYVAVLVNAFLIAFTSDFVPRLYYAYAHDGNLIGYVDDKFAYFDAATLPVTPIMSNKQSSATRFCRYLDYRLPPCSLLPIINNGTRWTTKSDGRMAAEFGAGIVAVGNDQHISLCSDNYELQPKWWILFALRLLFVLIYGLTILTIKVVVAHLIPDMPSEVFTQLQREQFLMRQAILQRGNSAIAAAAGGVPVSGGDNETKMQQQQCSSSTEKSSTTKMRTKRSAGFNNNDADAPEWQNSNVEDINSSGGGINRVFAQREMPTLSAAFSRGGKRHQQPQQRQITTNLEWIDIEAEEEDGTMERGGMTKIVEE